MIQTPAGGITLNLREQIVKGSDNADLQDVSSKNREDHEFDPEPKKPIIKTLPQAENLAEQLQHFAQFHGHEQLSLAINKVNNDLLHEIKLYAPKAQATITDFFLVVFFSTLIRS